MADEYLRGSQRDIFFLSALNFLFEVAVFRSKFDKMDGIERWDSCKFGLVISKGKALANIFELNFSF